jgi:hypothetical protein
MGKAKPKSEPDGDTTKKQGQTCRAIGCTRTLPPYVFMCRKHWRLVPGDLKREVWRNYTVAKAKGRQLSEEWDALIVKVVEAVAQIKKDPPAGC